MPSEKLRAYIEADKNAKEWESKKDSYKPYITKLLRRCKKQGIKLKGISISKGERFKLDEVKLYEWLKDSLPEDQLEYITVKTVNLENLQNLILDGKLDSTQFPEELYSSSQYTTIRISHKEK